MQHFFPWMGAVGLLVGGLIIGGAATHACTIDLTPSASADGRLDRVNQQRPTGTSHLASYASFVFPRVYTARHLIAFTEDRRELARSLTTAAMRRPWRWTFGDRQTAYGWTIRHAYAHPGTWRLAVDAYDPGTKQWWNFDQVQITIVPVSREHQEKRR